MGSRAILAIVLWIYLYFICRSEGAFSDSGVPCYLHPSGDRCHYRVKPDSPTCTSAEKRKMLTNGLYELNRTFTALETKLIRLGIIPPDNACSELPSLNNGGVVYSDLNLAPGCEGRYICDEGFAIHTLNGHKEFTCTEDGVWDGDVLEVPVQCLLAVNQCEHPTVVVNGNITFEDDDPSNILPGDMIEYACGEWTKLQGPQFRFCQRNGNWSDVEPQCVALNTKEEHKPEKLGMILGSSFGTVSAVMVVVVVVIIVVVVSLKRRRWKYSRHERGLSSGLVVYDNDPSMNTGVNESRHLFDSQSPSSVKEETDHSVIVKTPKVIVKSPRKASKKNIASRKELEESMM